MRALILLAGAALCLGACNKSNDNAEANVDMNAMGADTTMTGDANMMTDANGAVIDANGAATGPGGADANTATNTQQEMAKDKKTNDPDTNLANGM